MRSTSALILRFISTFLANIANNINCARENKCTFMQTLPYLILLNLCHLWHLNSLLHLVKSWPKCQQGHLAIFQKKSLWSYFLQSSITAVEVKCAFWRVIRLSELEFSSSALTVFKIFGQDSWQVLPLMCGSMLLLPPPLKHPNYHSCHSDVCELTHLFLMGWKLP